MNATGRTERAGRVGQTYGSMVKRFCTIGWALTGLIVAAMVAQAADVTLHGQRSTPSATPACTCSGPGWSA